MISNKLLKNKSLGGYFFSAKTVQGDAPTWPQSMKQIKTKEDSNHIMQKKKKESKHQKKKTIVLVARIENM